MKAVEICVGWKETYLMIRIKQEVQSRSCYQRMLCEFLTLDIFEHS